jgi:hypothetical protein
LKRRIPSVFAKGWTAMKNRLIYLFFLGGTAIVFLSVFSLVKKEFRDNYLYKDYLTGKKKTVIVEIAGSKKTIRPNSHINAEVTGRLYTIKYSFEDHDGISRKITLRYDKSRMEKEIYSFGIRSPRLTSDSSGEMTIESKRRLKNATRSGMYSWVNARHPDKGRGYRAVIRPDYRKMIRHYADYTKPIAAFIEKSVGASATVDDKINFALRFCQDIPYGIPPGQFNGKTIGEIFPPPQLLVNMYGDCDSKSLLLACILQHFETPNLVFVHLPDQKHMCMGIQRPILAGQKSFVYKGQTYQYLEPTGGKYKIGESPWSRNETMEVVPIY